MKIWYDKIDVKDVTSYLGAIILGTVIGLAICKLI
tara:strand:+ start:210 stop:314 length:105 start_codon:yes stop_codon:yes gene_type:complete